MHPISDCRDCFSDWAIIVFRALNEVLKDKSLPPERCLTVMHIATKLGLIKSILDDTPVYLIEPEVYELCQILSDNFNSNIRAQRPLKGIEMLFGRQTQEDELVKKDSSIAFFKAAENEHLINAISHKCFRIYELLEVCNEGDGDSVPANFSPSTTNRLIDLSNNLFNALELHIKCDPKELSKQDDHQSEAWHPTRLCLIEDERDFPSMSLLISPMQMAHWQDFHLIIEPENSTALDDNSPSPQPAFCHLVDTQQYNHDCVEISFDPSKCQFQLQNSKNYSEPGPGRGEILSDVLRQFQLTPKDKVILAYIIAQAYHHFYDSDLMRIKWTSETIWFMPPATKNDDILLRPYLIFPFGKLNDPEEDFVDNARLVHRYPRILAIGILLLEIALSKPFQPISQPNNISEANCNHKIADNWLKSFKKTTWEGFTHKTIFDTAIEYCIRESRLPVNTKNRFGPVGAAKDLTTKILPDKQQSILEQRKKFYMNVVRPLKYLAETGFGHKIGDKLCIGKKPLADSLSTELSLQNELSNLEASFHSGNTVKPEKWLKDLNSIGTIIERQRRIHGVETAIRVAILDTGIHESDDSNTSWKIKNKRDFVEASASNMTDVFGHGTLMARLVQNCSPSAEIIIGRVAKSTNDLKDSQENIKQAILWAGVECQADIISMSFGFPKDHKGIDNAIRTVQSQRNESVLFLASAGNSGFEDENFPARHPSVISVYAANCRGTFMETNPRLPDGAPAIWGTYGGDVPTELYADLQEKHPRVCQPGSSIATAVAAGISATMIAYADLLPSLEPSANESDRLSRLKLLRKKSGIEALFKSMVKKNDGSRMWFIDPISFWRDTSDDGLPTKHFTRYSKIHSCLQHVSSQQAGTF
ncbi:hypothetical protein V8C35DRAFT_325439 [Trichoderma chlorosporum]